jgi:predicted unusual protein kinase regulating ubiquinone biosynthesis (AarF/ABC1/UbiB family)
MTTKEQQDAEASLRARMLAQESVVPTSSLRRLWRTGSSAVGLARQLVRGRDGEAIDLAAISEIVGGLGGLKGVAMKVGQMLGHVDPGVPEELRGMLSLLQTSAPATAFEAVAAEVRASLGARAEALLAGMERAPVAVASIGQVHRARLPDGTEVAVKVRHPGIEAAIAADFRSAGVGKLFAAVTGAAAIREVIDEAREAFLAECDFRREATNQQAFARLFHDDPVIVVPAVLEAWCSDRVLVTRWIPGRSLAQFLAGAPAQHERDAAGAALFRFWVRTLYREGLFHADPHPGNFAFCDRGKLVIYDFGCVRRFEAPLRRAFARLAAATRDDDPAAIADAITAAGGRVPKDPDGRAHTRALLRGFFAPLLTPGPRRITIDEGMHARELLRDKRALLGLQLPGRMLFLFRLRFGLYAVLAQLGAEVDWAGLEDSWARAGL